YSVSLSTKSKELEKNLKQKMEVNTPEVNAPAEIDLPDINPEQEVAKEMAKEAVKEVAKVTEKKYWTKEQPAIVFISGFDWLGASSVKGSYDGIPEMGKAIEHAKHFTWDQEEE